MRSHTLLIAWNTFQEARHNKVLYIALGFAAALVIFSIFLGEVSLHQQIKVVKDTGMAAISLLGVFVAIYMGATSLYRELQMRTIYTIISKPIKRIEILIGKYLGMLLTLAVVVILMSAFLYLVTFFEEQTVDWKLIPAIFLIYVELAIVAAMAVLFSSFSSPFMTGVFTAGLFIVGRVTHELGQFGERSESELFRLVATSAQKVFDLEAFDIRARVVHDFPVYREDVIYALIYAFFLIALFLGISIIAFNRRDLK